MLFYLLNLLAVVAHVILDLGDRLYQQCRAQGSRRELWNAPRTLMNKVLVERWTDLLRFYLADDVPSPSSGPGRGHTAAPTESTHQPGWRQPDASSWRRAKRNPDIGIPLRARGRARRFYCRHPMLSPFFFAPFSASLTGNCWLSFGVVASVAYFCLNEWLHHGFGVRAKPTMQRHKEKTVTPSPVRVMREAEPDALPSGSPHLPPFEVAELPPYPGSFWRVVGPGAVLLGLSIGAGELIIWPTVVGRYGAGMIWAAGVGILLQMIINLELARYALATGETAYTGYARLWRGFAYIFILLTLTSWLLPGWARSCGEAVRALVLGPQATAHDGGPDWAWTTLTFAAVAVILFGPKIIYRSVEISTEVMVVVALVGLIVLALIMGTSDAWAYLGRGVLNLGHKEPEVSYAEFFSWIVFAGAGGTANLFYTFYLRDKNLGMGIHVPVLTNILRDRNPRDSLTGYRFPDHPVQHRRWRRWWRHAVQDQVLFFWFLNSVTILLFIFASLAVVFPLTEQGVITWQGTKAFYGGKEISFLALEALVLGRFFRGATTIFLLVAVATLLSTQLTLVDGVSRSLADIIHTNFPAARSRPLGFWYAVTAIAWIVLGCLLTYVLETSTRAQSFLFLTGFSGGIAMALYCPLTLLMNRRFLPRSARPGWFMTALMIGVSAFYIGYAASSVIAPIVSRVTSGL